MKITTVLKLMNFWPPFLGAGIKVKKVDDDCRSIEVEMKFRKWNKNRVGTQYGGSIYSMTDPFYALMLREHLGKEYIVWDKAAAVRFKKPGRGTLTAKFNLSAERIAEIKKAADDNYKTEPFFQVEIKDDQGNLIAEVDKLLYVRRKDHIPRPKR